MRLSGPPAHLDRLPDARRSRSIARPHLLAVGLCGLFALVAASAFGQTAVASDPVDCLPVGDNGIAWATVENLPPDAETRLYFRRMHDSVEDLYWVEMQPAGDGRYWGIFPEAESHSLKRMELVEERAEIQREVSWAQWWREKDGSDDRNPNNDLDQDLIRERASQGKQIERDWLGTMSDQEFQDWLETLDNEPTEYYTSVTDWQGNELARSRTRVARVDDNCRVNLTPEQLGHSENMIVGETAYWQRGEKLFHWECDGIVARVDPNGIRRGDEICRACVIAWYERPGLLIPAVVGASAVTGVVLIDDEPPLPVSPSEP